MHMVDLYHIYKRIYRVHVAQQLAARFHKNAYSALGSIQGSPYFGKRQLILSHPNL